jgi:endonuclease YncB( thermonuclease family)
MCTTRGGDARSHRTRLPALGRLAASVLLAAFSLCAAAESTLSGRVVDVIDGDSIVVATSRHGQVEVRLAEIDAPEHGQPYGLESRQRLSALVGNAHVDLTLQTLDEHGRTVARVRAGDLDVCAEMVRAGAAWAYRRYLRDDALLSIEDDARRAERGLWQLPAAERIPPWEWRHAGQQARLAADPGAACRIKGNVSSRGERIYHVPGQRYYDATRISPSQGERWFCSEAEARAAGWRRSRQWYRLTGPRPGGRTCDLRRKLHAA